MKPFFILILTLSLCILTAQDFQQMLHRADSLVNYTDTDFQARYSIVQDKPGEGRITTVAAVFRRDAGELYSIVIESPTENKGQGYLKQGDTLWVYDPDSRQFNSTSSRDRFQNSNARNSDFTRSTLAIDYNVIHAEQVQLGRYLCWKLELEGVVDELSYPRMYVWIDEDYLVRKTEDLSLSRQLLRTTVIPAYHDLNGRYVPHKILMIDQLAGARIDGVFQNEKTQITIENPALKDLPDMVFSKTFLERVNR